MNWRLFFFFSMTMTWAIYLTSFIKLKMNTIVKDASRTCLCRTYTLKNHKKVGEVENITLLKKNMRLFNFPTRAV